MPVHAPTGGAEPLPDGYNDHNINKLQQASAIRRDGRGSYSGFEVPEPNGAASRTREAASRRT
jgi:hypothetical protein